MNELQFLELLRGLLEKAIQSSPVDDLGLISLHSVVDQRIKEIRNIQLISELDSKD